MDIVPDERSEIPHRAFDMQAKLGTILLGLIGGEFLCERTDRPCKVVGNNGGAAQPLHCIPALDDRLPGLAGRNPY